VFLFDTTASPAQRRLPPPITPFFGSIATDKLLMSSGRHYGNDYCLHTKQRLKSMPPKRDVMDNGVKGRILYVEDNKDECELIREILKDHDVTCVAMIAEAHRLLENNRFDLAIIDEHLPDGSGMELCRMLTADKPATPCIMVSGDTFITMNEAKDAGARALLIKSIDNYVEELRWSVGHLELPANA
jgi:CheY-like chemotaxis protein